MQHLIGWIIRERNENGKRDCDKQDREQVNRIVRRQHVKNQAANQNNRDRQGEKRMNQRRFALTEVEISHDCGEIGVHYEENKPDHHEKDVDSAKQRRCFDWRVDGKHGEQAKQACDDHEEREKNRYACGNVVGEIVNEASEGENVDGDNDREVPQNVDRFTMIMEEWAQINHD